MSAELGVAGYPGDRDFGAFMYEHWANVKIDLARTDNLLSYEIDTMPGERVLPSKTWQCESADGSYVRRSIWRTSLA